MKHHELFIHLDRIDLPRPLQLNECGCRSASGLVNAATGERMPGKRDEYVRVLSARAIAQMMKLTPAGFWKWERRHNLNHLLIGRHRYYFPDGIVQR